MARDFCPVLTHWIGSDYGRIGSDYGRVTFDHLGTTMLNGTVSRDKIPGKETAVFAQADLPGQLLSVFFWLSISAPFNPRPGILELPLVLRLYWCKIAGKC